MIPSAKPKTALLTLARILWVLITGLQLWIFIGGLGPYYEELLALCQAEPCSFLILTDAELAGLATRGISHAGYAAFGVALEAIAQAAILVPVGLVFWRMGREWFGLLVSIALALFGLNFMAEADNAFMRAYPAFAAFYQLLSPFAAIPFVALFYLFPDGRFVPGWTRRLLVVVTLFALVDPLLVRAGLRMGPDPMSPVYVAILLGCLALGMYAQVHRYRHVSSRPERQQTRWVLFGLFGLLFVIFTYVIFIVVLPQWVPLARLYFYLYIYPLDLLLYMLFPVSMTVSILRYRLWDLDLIVRRTLSYALLTGLLGLLFFGVVIILQWAAGTITGRADSPITTVVSTLAIAALFNPLRIRTQAFIDRRFYRAKYDAEQTLARFSDQARDEVDIQTLAVSLLNVVDETVQPDSVSLWIRD